MRDDMHAAGFPEPDDPEPVAGLSVDAPRAGQVLVNRDDLVTVLAGAEGFIGGKDNGAFARLAAAAGVQ